MASRLPAAAIAVAIMLIATFLGARPAAAATDAQDKTFMTENAQTDLAEISGASIALARSGTHTVRSLAATISSDHKKALSQLKALAGEVGVTLPTKPNSFQLRQAKTLKTVATNQFDETYLQVQEQGHQASISNTESEIAHGSNSKVVAFARTYLQTAQRHLQMVQQAMVVERRGPTPVASAPSQAGSAPSAVVTTGPLAHGAKRKPSSDTWWLIGLAIVIVLAVGGLLLRLRTSARRRG